MAVHTRHPVAAPPQAPIRETTGHLLLRGWCILVLFSALATGFWFNLIGITGLVIMVAAGSLTSAVLWIILRPQVQWRRLPWFAVAYVLWAGVSVFWSRWPDATAATWGVLVVTTMNGMFIAAVLTWRECVRAIATALKWVIGLSLAFELWVSLIVRHPILPNFLLWDGKFVKELYWSRDNLFDPDGRIQGIVGNASLLSALALLAIIVFAVRIAGRAPHRGWLIAWIAVAALLLIKTTSAAMTLALVAVAAVLGTVLLMRTTRRPGERTKYYVLFAAVGVAITALVLTNMERILSMLGRSGDLTGRTEIWSAVLERASQHPLIGWGFTTPWLPWEPMFRDWIFMNDLPVFHAHNVWIDVFFQLGTVGVILLGLTYLSFIWRAWFFAVDRPRWDLASNRPYEALTLLPTLVITLLLVQGLAESRPLMEWGWMFLVMFAFKIKQAPLVGRGVSEQRLAGEQGDYGADVR